jgi:hypothetical protein
VSRSSVDISQALEAVVAEVARAGASAASGEPVHMEDLPDRMAPICAAIAALPKAEAQSYAPTVRALIEELDAISGMLRERRDALRRRLADLDPGQS